MKRFLSTTTTTLGFLLLFVAAGAAQTPEERVDRLMAGFDRTTPGAVVGVVRGGELVFARGYGMASLSHQVPLSARAVMNIGSTSKQFTAFALALLADRGELSLDDDVREYVPELPDFGETVTLRHLLTHTSGYREFLNTLALQGRRIMQGDHISRDEIIEIVQRQPELQNTPGAEFNYNNTGYALAALVVERVTDRPFPEWMAEEVFAPLGMEHTVVRSRSGQVVPDASVGYVPSEEEGFAEARDLGASMGAGGIHTTAADLARWMRNLGTGELGGPHVIRELTTPFVLTSGDTTGYGLGIFVDERRGLTRWQHGGADTAHRSTFVYLPELDAGYVVLSNHAEFPGTIPPAVARAFFEEHMTQEAPEAVAAEPPGPVAVDAAALDAYVGRYALEVRPSFIITITREEDQLIGQAIGQPAFELAATSDSTFTITGVEASLTFHQDEDGIVDELTLHQNGDHTARRIDEAEDLDPAEYTGRYFSEELETFYTVALEDDDLVVRHRRFGPVVLTHSTADIFRAEFPIATIAFERDEAGRVDGFRVSNVRSRDIRFARVE